MSSDAGPVPTLREDRIYEMRQHLYDWLVSYHPSLMRTCMTCVHFQESNEVCKRYNLRPPARVIAYGCKDYMNEEEIPF
jgi:hypothetical protein